MSLNKSKGNMYEWVNHTWNPLAGECPHRCSYCSTNKLMRYPGIKNKYSGEPRIDEKQMKTNLGKGNFIFVCAQSDLFAEGVPSGIIWQILDYCDEFDNQYLFQTKNPESIANYAEHPVISEKSVICTTIETNRHYPHIMRDSPTPLNRALAMNYLSNDIGLKSFLTIEPVMDFDLDDFTEYIKNFNPVQVNIGADSGNNNLPEPSKEKIQELIERLKAFTKVELKTNLKRIMG